MREARKKTEKIIDRMLRVAGQIGLTYGQLEVRTKVARSTWYRILSKERKLSLEKFEEFCIAARCDPRIFFEDERWEDDEARGSENGDPQSGVV